VIFVDFLMKNYSHRDHDGSGLGSAVPMLRISLPACHGQAHGSFTQVACFPPPLTVASVSGLDLPELRLIYIN
jgi:hypothetical protein